MTSVINVSQVHYPESDGKPMGETDEHRTEMIRQLELLELLKLVVDEGSLRFYRQDTGQRLPTRAERAEHEAERAEREAERAECEARARQAAEAELARLREELARRPPLDTR